MSSLVKIETKIVFCRKDPHKLICCKINIKGFPKSNKINKMPIGFNF